MIKKDRACPSAAFLSLGQRPKPWSDYRTNALVLVVMAEPTAVAAAPPRTTTAAVRTTKSTVTAPDSSFEKAAIRFLIMFIVVSLSWVCSG